jgi:hypothetical protein
MKPELNHWIALVAAMVFVAMQHREKPMLARAVIAGISGALGHTLSGEIAETVGWLGPLGWLVVVTAFGYAALDIGLALVSDRESIKEVLKARLGGRK